jgi:hypothetical protein
MKKTFYFLIRSAMFLVTLLMVNALLAQETLTWTGAVSTDGTDPANWEPQQAIAGNILVIDSIAKVTSGRMPVFAGSENIEINALTLNATGVMTIAFDDSLDLFNVTTEYFEPHGTINVNRGTLQGRRVHIEDTLTVINVNSGGLLVARKYLFMSGDGNDRPTAGYLNISGTGKVIWTNEQVGGFGRFPTDTTTGVITLYPMGTLDLYGNQSVFCNQLKAKNQIMAAAGYDVVIKYDEAADYTYVSIRDKMAFVIEPTADQFLVTNEAGSKIGMVQNDGYAATTTFNWQYSTTSGSGYQSFSPAVTTDSIEAVFDTPGKYFVVCVGDGTKTSNEVIFFVGSDKVTIAPGGQQFLRPGMDGAMLAVTRDAVITSVEWKWSATPGEGHVSFTPAATGDEFTPNFDTEGLYYVICEGKDAGDNPYPSKDVKIKVDQTRYNITWNGSAGNSAYDPNNWDPIANVDGNTIVVNGPETFDNGLLFSGPGNRKIYEALLNDTLATMTVDMGGDTLTVDKGESYGIWGEITVVSGVLSYRDLRHERNTGRIIVKNTGEFLIRSSNFMTGNKAGTTGAYIDIMDNGKFISIATQPARWCLDTLKSVITITGKGMFQVPKDYRGGAETYMAKNQIVTSEMEELVVTWPVLYMGDTVTRITAKSLLVFDIAPLGDQLVGTGETIAALSTVNDADRTGFQWKFSLVPGGPYTALPGQTANSFAGALDIPGVYYVVCEGYGADTVVSSEVKVTVVSVTIAPEADQNLLEAEAGTPLTVTESTPADSREWKSSTTSGSGYTPVVPPQSGASYTPLFLSAGTYYVVCASSYGTKTINSNEVTVIVTQDNTGVEDNLAKVISLYPNPARQAFYLDAGDYSSYNVKISDITGRTVLRREFVNVSGPQKIEIGDSGIYFVEISTADGSHTAKMIIK